MDAELKLEIIETMLWMIEHFKWAHKQAGMGGDYSPELKKAMVICDRLITEVQTELKIPQNILETYHGHQISSNQN